MIGFEEQEDFEPVNHRRRRAKTAILIMLFFAIGTTLASNITLNNGQRIEYGTGLFQVRACASWIYISLGSDGTNVFNMKISGMDPRTCPGNNLQLTLFNGNTQLNIFQGDNESSTVMSNQVLLQIGGVSSETAANNYYPTVWLIDPHGVNIHNGDPYESVYWNKTAGTFTITFTNPQALTSQVTAINVQTTGNGLT